MTIVDHISQALQQYDTLLYVLMAIAAPGGIWFWVDKYRNRIRVKVRNFDFSRGDVSGRSVAFEIENIGTASTSLEPTFRLSFYSPKRERQNLTFRMDGDDRRLLSCELKPIVGWHNDPETVDIAFGWYMVLTLSLTRGGNARVRFRNAEFRKLGWLRYQWERMLFKVFGKLPK